MTHIYRSNSVPNLPRTHYWPVCNRDSASKRPLDASTPPDSSSPLSTFTLQNPVTLAKEATDETAPKKARKGGGCYRRCGITGLLCEKQWGHLGSCDFQFSDERSAPLGQPGQVLRRDQRMCSICLSELSSDVAVRLPGCGHVFHKTCIVQCSRQCGRRCP